MFPCFFVFDAPRICTIKMSILWYLSSRCQYLILGEQTLTPFNIWILLLLFRIHEQEGRISFKEKKPRCHSLRVIQFVRAGSRVALSVRQGLAYLVLRCDVELSGPPTKRRTPQNTVMPNYGT